MATLRGIALNNGVRNLSIKQTNEAIESIKAYNSRLPENDPSRIDLRKMCSSLLHEALNFERHSCTYHQRNILNILLKAGADPDFIEKGVTPLISAASNQEFRLVEALMKAGANPRCIHPKTGKTALHYIAEHAQEFDIQWEEPIYYHHLIIDLAEAGVSPDSVDKMGKTPLHYAARENKESFVKYLLELGASPDLTDINQQTPLFLAIPGSPTKSLLEISTKNHALFKKWKAKKIAEHKPDLSASETELGDLSFWRKKSEPKAPPSHESKSECKSVGPK